MATLLYRLGRVAHAHPWRFLIAWVIILAGILGGGLAMSGKTDNSFSIPGTQSQEAIDRLSAVFPATAGASGQLVVAVPSGDSVEAQPYRAAIETLAKDAAKVDGVSSALSPFNKYASDAVSKDHSTAIVSVQFDKQQNDVSAKTLADIHHLGHVATDAGMTIGFGGSVFQDNSIGFSPTEGIGVIFAGIVLFIAFGSLLAAGMPLLTAIVGVGVTMGGVVGASAFAIINSSTPLLALMIGLAVGIDYGLFILSRHRTQLAQGMDARESVATAVATAGSAVVFAGGTVMIALLGLIVVGIPFLSSMGVAAAAGVFVAIAASATLLPALMALAGTRLAPKPDSRTARRANAIATGHKTMGRRWVELVMKAPVVAVVAVIAVLGVVSIPAFSLELGLPTGATQPAGTEARTSYDMIAKGFGAGHNGPLVVLVDITQTTKIEADLNAIRADLAKLPDVSSVGQGLPNATLDTAVIQVIPKSGPDDPATSTLVDRIRDLSPSIDKKWDTPIMVTGATAVQIDVSNRLNSALLPFGIIVVGLSILLLMMVFRSVFVPIKAAIGFLLSVFTSFGVVVAIFQWGWLDTALGIVPGPVLSFLPIILMAVLFGLAMDYEVFLVSGMREAYVHGKDARQAVVTGFSGAARVVTAAALIMFFVFASFIPDGDGVIKAMAVGLAVGIAADAFLVRMTLVPAVMTLLGRAAWWMPRWLSRLLPDVDIEGERLLEHRTASEWAATQCAGQLVSTDRLVVGSGSAGGATFGPYTASVAPGELLLASGSTQARTLLSATLAGRLDPVAGRAQVGGHPLPSESASVTRMVALENISGTDRTEVRVGVGDLLVERLRLTQPWYRVGVHRRARQWLDRVNAVLAEHGAPPVAAGDRLDQVPQLGRAVALAAVALAEHTPVVMLDQRDSFAHAADEAALLAALDRLAPTTTTIVLGVPVGPRELDTASVRRPVHAIDLDAPAPLAGAATTGAHA